MSGKSTSDDALPISVFERIFRSYNATGFLPILLTVLLVAFALFIPNFVAVQNLLNVLRSSSYLVIIAAGQMLVLIVGGFDLSQGAVVALTSVSSALVMVATLSVADVIRRAGSDEPAAIQRAFKTTTMQSLLGGGHAFDDHNHAHTDTR